jgi:DNA replication protein DnaC
MADMTPTADTEPAPTAAVVADLARRFPHLKRAAELAATLGPEERGPQRETPEEARERQERRSAAFRTRWEEMVPAMYRGASLDDLDDDQHAVRLRAWLRSGSLHLVLAGAVGTGKTHAAYAIGNQALAQGMSVEAWNVGDLLDALRPGSNRADADRRARHAQLLILDDLVAKATEWEAERMTLLLDERVRSQRLTIVTTNITGPQVQETWGPRLMDRLRYRMTSLTFTGESRRTADW